MNTINPNHSSTPPDYSLNELAKSSTGQSEVTSRQYSGSGGQRVQTKWRSVWSEVLRGENSSAGREKFLSDWSHGNDEAIRNKFQEVAQSDERSDFFDQFSKKFNHAAPYDFENFENILSSVTGSGEDAYEMDFLEWFELGEDYPYSALEKVFDIAHWHENNSAPMKGNDTAAKDIATSEKFWKLASYQLTKGIFQLGMDESSKLAQLMALDTIWQWVDKKPDFIDGEKFRSDILKLLVGYRLNPEVAPEIRNQITRLILAVCVRQCSNPDYRQLIQSYLSTLAGCLDYCERNLEQQALADLRKEILEGLGSIKSDGSVPLDVRKRVEIMLAR